ncbi:MAG: chemotaxis protein CheW [Gammaproteobacteria bacterium]|nr:chemotaxis protein CheW [Gammaproteobacteria bacterium]
MSTEAESALEIRGVLLPLNKAQLLLPNAAVSEVVPYQDLTPASDVPEWFLGFQAWRFQEIPVVSFEDLVEAPSVAPGPRSRVAICNTLGGNQRCQFIGILLASIPRLVRVTEEIIAPQSNLQELGSVIQREVVINGEDAWIPDMSAVEWVVQEALS